MRSVTEIKANEEYTVGFMSDNRQMLLDVSLGVNFPNEKPKIIITPRIQHEWIPDPKAGEIQSAPGLLNVITQLYFLRVDILISIMYKIYISTVHCTFRSWSCCASDNS